jgi:excisionase family DNA binding protein
MIRDLTSETRAFVTVQEAAEYLNVAERTLRYQIQKGALPANRVGTLIRIPVNELRAYIGMVVQPDA